MAKKDINLYVINEDNDIYYGNLLLLKKRQNVWADSHPKGKILKYLLLVVVAIGIGIMFLPLKYAPGREPVLWLVIGIVLLVICAFGIYINKTTRPPFEKIHNARFEASDKGLYYAYQYGMKIYNYFIEDTAIKKMVYDDKSWTLYIEGTAEVEVIDKKRIWQLGEIDRMYCLIPVDGYDMDDLLEPYGDLVERNPGSLRRKFVNEKGSIPQLEVMNRR